MTRIILPGKTIGIIGGGQLGRMMALVAKEMGYKIAVLDPTKTHHVHKLLILKLLHHMTI